MRPLVVLVGGIYHADADSLLRTKAEVLGHREFVLTRLYESA